MKKLFVVIISCVMLLAVMAACSSHSHVETVNWSADVTGHWKLCEECGGKLQIGDHTMDDAFVCTVCRSEIMNWDDSVSIFTYDEHENIIRVADYGSDGNLIGETVNEYEYDAGGNIAKSKETVDGRLSSESEYTVADGESIPVKYTYYNEDGSKYINEYDSCGNVIKLIDYDADGNVNMQIDSRYAQNGDGEWYESARTECYVDGSKIEAEYNEYNDNTLRVIYDADGNVTLTQTWEYTYDDNGVTASEKEYVNGVIYQEITYKTVTDENGWFSYAETVTMYEEDGGRTVCVYDENNELVSGTRYDASGEIIG